MLSSLKQEQQEGFNLHSLTWLLEFTCSHEKSSSVAILDLDMWTLNIVHAQKSPRVLSSLSVVEALPDT